MFGLFPRNIDGEAVTEIKVMDLTIGFTVDHLTLTGGDVCLRISKADCGILTDRELLKARFREAEAPVDRREWNSDAEARFIQISRLLKHGCDLYQTAKALGEKESDLRAFWGWAVSLKLSQENPTAAAVTAALEADILPLKRERWTPSGLDPGVIVKQTRLTGPRVTRLLKDGSVKSAADSLGVEVSDLERWVDVNSKLLEVLK